MARSHEDRTGGFSGGRTLVCAPSKLSQLASVVARACESEVTTVALGEPKEGFDHALDGSEAEFSALLAELGTVRSVVFLGAIDPTPFTPDDPSALERGLKNGLIALFHLSKALLARGMLGEGLDLTVVTADAKAVHPRAAIQPSASAVWGFLKVLGQEAKQVRIRVVDLSLSDITDLTCRLSLARWLGPALTAPTRLGLEEVVVRAGRVLRQGLARIQLPEVPHSPFRHGGTYLLLGGAGGIGRELSKWLAKEHQAKLIWVGRRSLDAELQRAKQEIEALGAEVFYLQADIRDEAVVKAGLAEATKRLGPVQGAIHSAIALHDARLERMTERELRIALTPKVEGSVALYRALRDQPLDFLLFFSSAQSFAANPGQSNYAAGCSFKDAFAQWLRTTPDAFSGRDVQVRVVNWGYWGSVGIVASEHYRRKLAAMGVYSIEPEQGIEAVQRILSHPVDQVMAFSGSETLFAELGVDATKERIVLPPSPHRFFDSAVVQVPSHNEDKEAWQQVERFGRLALLSAMQRMGALVRPGEHCDHDKLWPRLGVQPRFGRLCEALLTLLIDAGFLYANGALAATARVADGLPPSQLLRLKEELSGRFPAMASLLELLHLCMESLPSVLRGERAATEVLFPGASMHLLEGMYKGNATADYFNDIVSTVVQRARRTRREGKVAGPLRILEVGAGTGGTTAPVLASLRDAQDVQYAFTDVSQAFVVRGRKLFGPTAPFASFSVLDVERPLPTQGIAPGSFDLVLATNVLHATLRIRNTLANLKSALASGGLLIVNEATQVRDFTTLIFGLLDGWWAYAEGDLRLPGSPLLSPELWREALTLEGYGRVATLGADAQGESIGQHVIVAESDGIVELPRQVLAKDAAIVTAPSRQDVPMEPTVAQPAPARTTQTDAATLVRQAVARALEMPEASVDLDAPFSDMGIDSVLAVDIARRLEDSFGTALRATELFDFPTVRELSVEIKTRIGQGKEQESAWPPPSPNPPVARDLTVASATGVTSQGVQIDEPVNTATDLRPSLARCVADALEMAPTAIGFTETFADLGVDSVLSVSIVERINAALGASLRATDLFNFSSIEELAQHLLAQGLREPKPATRVETPVESSSPVGSRAPTSEVESLFSAPPIARPDTAVRAEAHTAHGASSEGSSDFPDLGAPALPSLASLGMEELSHESPGHEVRPEQDLREPQRPAAIEAGRTVEPIAIIGLAGRFADADDLEAYWANLSAGRDSVRAVPSTRWRLEDYLSEGETAPPLFAGLLRGIDAFDSMFFGISPKEAEVMDPQQRLFLEEAYKALEVAGYPPQALRKRRCGVYVGAGPSDYGVVLRKAGVLREPYALMGNAGSILPARVSYALNLRGPAVALDTACSASLVAVHLACEALRSGEIELALAGGVHIMSSPEYALLTHKAGMVSRDGRCKAFDATADGMVPAEGVGAVVLKRLDAAQRDGDTIHGVILASGLNQDGRTNGITAPSAPAQTELLHDVLERAGISAETVSYVETHGTGTKLGDPIEVQALGDAFRAQSKKVGGCAIGSVKSNVGHATMAAGMASLLKVLLAIRERQLPPSLHFHQPNPLLALESSPFYVNDTLRPWRSEHGGPLRAGISAFGFSGTNAHLIVEEPPRRAPRATAHEGPVLLVLSARDDARLRVRAQELLRWHEHDGGQTPLADVGYTLLCRRAQHPVRIACVVTSMAEWQDVLAQLAQGRLTEGVLRADLREPPSDTKVDETQAHELLHKVEQGMHLGAASLQILAKSYLGGTDLPFSTLYVGAQLASLPTYPFEPVSHWVGTPPSLDAAAVLSSREEPYVDALLTPQWVQTEQAPCVDLPRDGVTWLLCNQDSAELVRPLLARLGTRSTQAVVVAPSHVTVAGVSTSQLYPLDFASSSAGTRLAQRRDVNAPDLLIDLSDLWHAPRSVPTPHAGKLALFQGLILRHVEGGKETADTLRIMHVTRGLEALPGAEPSLAGADFAGLMRVVAAEHQRVQATRVDVDLTLSEGDALAQLLSRELTQSDRPLEVCLRDGRRFVRSLAVEGLDERAPAELPGFSSTEVLVITGGTGGIGRALSEAWVARGVRKLALLGLSSIPPYDQWSESLARGTLSPDARATIESLRALEARGVELLVYMGSLTDRPALGAFFAHVRRTLGTIAGVVHCAGAFVRGQPAFIRRDLSDVPRVMEPKVHGLLALADVLRDDDPRFFVLFSSISALFPTLGIGIVDYAMANAFLSHYAEHAFRSGRTQVQSLVWANWSEVGIGEVDNANYRQLGLRAHSTDAAIRLLASALTRSGSAPVLSLAQFRDQLPNPTHLLAVRHDSRDKQRFVRGDEGVRKEVALRDVDDHTAHWLRAIFVRELKLKDESVSLHARFDELGVDSILMVELLKTLEQVLGDKVDPTCFLEYPNLAELSKYFHVQHAEALARLRQDPPGATPSDTPTTVPCSTKGGELTPAALPLRSPTELDEQIAIIGLGCRMPQSPDPETFWANLRAGFDGISEVPKTRWDAGALYSAERARGKSISKWGGFVDGIEWFSPAYFGIREQVAAQVDPLIRLFLEAAVQCVRDAGYEDRELAGKRMGVFAGSRVSTYAQRVRHAEPDTVVGVGQNFIAAHLAQRWDLRGPAMVVDSACSSSLVSLQLACRSLALGETDLALAGGVDVLLDEIPYVTLSEARALSPTGRCHTFDVAANGFVPGEGAGVVMLKRYADAVRDGDRIYGVIEAIRLNNDGRTMGITTPNPTAQLEVIRDALQAARADARSVTYVEAHGTGTMIGDPFELKGLTKAFETYTADKQFCAVGSVKTNIGHLFSAAGVASVLKVALCLYHGEIVPTLHCHTPNPRFAFAQSPFFPATSCRAWEGYQGVRRAGISSFGFGGTNAHLIMRNFDPTRVPGYAARRVPLPKVSFERARYWLEKPNAAPPVPERAPSASSAKGMLSLEWDQEGSSEAPASSGHRGSAEVASW